MMVNNDTLPSHRRSRILHHRPRSQFQHITQLLTCAFVVSVLCGIGFLLSASYQHQLYQYSHRYHSRLSLDSARQVKTQKVNCQHSHVQLSKSGTVVDGIDRGDDISANITRFDPLNMSDVHANPFEIYSPTTTISINSPEPPSTVDNIVRISCLGVFFVSTMMGYQSLVG
jgi:hypothetical protein